MKLEQLYLKFKSDSRVQVPDFHVLWRRAEEEFRPSDVQEILKLEKTPQYVPDFSINQKIKKKMMFWNHIPAISYGVAICAIVMFSFLYFQSMQKEEIPNLDINITYTEIEPLLIVGSDLTYMTDKYLDLSGGEYE